METASTLGNPLQTPQNRKPNTPAEAKQFAGRLQIWDHALSGLKLRDWTLEPNYPQSFP